MQKQETPQTPKSPQTPKKATFITLNAAINTHSKLSYGLTFGQVKRFGWFASVMTNFDFKGFKTDYECGNDFKISGSIPSYTGKVSFSSLSLTGGFVMKVSKPFGFKVGVGYGIRNLSYEVVGGKWVKNTDESVSGIDVLLGVNFHFGKFMFSIDGVTTNFKEYEAKIGLGVVF